MSETAAGKLTDKNLLTKNILINFLAQGVPLIIAVFTIPLIIKGYGTARFGILTLIWSIIGYSSIFDLGLGRALTQIVSKMLGAGDTENICVTVWTSLALAMALGVLASFLVCFFTPLIVNAINVPEVYRLETTRSIYILGLSLPFLIGIISLKGILEAYQEFMIISVLRLPVIIFNYLVPLVVLMFTKDLSCTVAWLVLGRIITFFVHLAACSYVIRDFFKKITFGKKHIKPLLKFGGWLTVSNIINPIMSSMDRFFIASLLSASVIAYYTTPQNVILSLGIIQGAIIGVMFPAFTAEFHKDNNNIEKLYNKTLFYSSLAMFVPIVLIVIFAKVGLSMWISPEFAEKSYRITQLLAIGMFIYAINQTSYSLIQSTGRADITAKVHIVELPIYLASLYFLVKTFGILGATYAWIIRATIDSILMHSIAFKIIKVNKQ